MVGLKVSTHPGIDENIRDRLNAFPFDLEFIVSDLLPCSNQFRAVGKQLTKSGVVV